ncbi:MAG: hypothetical protein U0822_13590 [Anaerolineae bacterium]
MSKVRSLPPSRQLEMMFLRVADGGEQRTYYDLIERGLRHTAAAYASQKVYRLFMELADLAEIIGVLPPAESLRPPLIIGSSPQAAHRVRMRGKLQILTRNERVRNDESRASQFGGRANHPKE